MFLHRLFRLKFLFWALFFLSCAVQDPSQFIENSSGSSAERSLEDGTQEEKSAYSPVSSTYKTTETPGNIVRKGFSFTLPDSLYELTGDIDDSSMPVEFFRTKGALRGEIRFQEVNSTTLAEFARTEMHSRRK